ncbi:hypothetical protein K503DRAFT_702409 [Rhizopogon vinicolor AM-OR11-026]|uniref:Uncharacterized protein n=1 Tax=Rhizopogon vinicolor AM-OR11-026 TaxID=1314800 RepID=A0A1B7MHX2_9AGAM|nr:hypothetical protein K503DRAFT_702409 [Rhizopogon vinicolor AM-OR11-026]
MLGFEVTTFPTALHHFETACLFKRSDYKTIAFPVLIFATALSPRRNPLALCSAVWWFWFHLLQSNVSNQAYSANEDVVNKPWRPLPSGRISVEDCRALR